MAAGPVTPALSRESMLRALRGTSTLRAALQTPAARRCLQQPARAPRLARGKATEAAADAAGSSFAEKAQWDTAVNLGVATFFGVIAYDQFVPEETKVSASLAIVRAFRTCGLEQRFISDKQLVDDYIKKYSTREPNAPSPGLTCWSGD